MMRLSKYSFTISHMPSGLWRSIVYDPLKSPVKTFIGRHRKEVHHQAIAFRNEQRARFSYRHAAIRNDN